MLAIDAAIYRVSHVSEDFDQSLYDVYIGDCDYHGQATDYLMMGKERFVLIHGDISIPIILPAPTSFKIIKQYDGSYQASNAERVCETEHGVEYSQGSIAQLLTAGAISRVSASSIRLGDFNLDGRTDFIDHTESDNDEAEEVKSDPNPKL